MKLAESILTRNPCYTAGRKITVKGLMLHSVGCPQPKASVFINSWNSPAHDTSCVHGFIDGNDGTVYQTLPWNHRGWHCGSGSKGSGNNTHIGVEMCEPACIKYTAGSNFTCSDIATAKAVAKRTYEAAVELFAYLCKKYSLNPLADGVIISHREGHSRGIASNHGDPEHLWTQLGMGYTMDSFRKAVKAAIGGSSSGGNGTDGYTKIMGNTVATAEQMKAYLKAKNPGVAQSVLDMIPLYLSEGKAEGVRGDIAFAQSCLETGNFTFSGSAVTLSQNNFCGMGVTSNGMKGNSFDTPQLGIREIFCKVMGQEEFSEGFFEETLERMVVQKTGSIDFHLKDGTVKTYETLKLRSGRHENTSTEEFAGKIRCASCGNLYHKYCCYGKYTYWRCSGKSRVRTECGGRDFQDSDIRKISAYLMGMEEFDGAEFERQIEQIAVLEDGSLECRFYGGKVRKWQRT